MLGLPPNIEHVIFGRADVQWNQRITIEWLKGKGFTITEVSGYTLSARRKFRHTFLSLFSMGRPKVEWYVLFTEEGRITIKSRYDYDSMFGVAFNDLGRQKKHLKEYEDILKTN